MRAAAVPWLAARFVIVVAWSAAWSAARHLDTAAGPLAAVSKGLLAWDASWNVFIAEHGYPGSGGAGEAIRFWPLFPMVGRMLAWPFGGVHGSVLVVVANVAAIAAGAILVRMTRVRFPDLDPARPAWVLAFWPAAFVLAFAYAEALLLALCAGAVVAWTQRRPSLAVALAGLAGMTRPTGALLAVYFVVECRSLFMRGSGRERLRAAAVSVAAPLGTGTFMAWCQWRYGDALAPVKEQLPLRGDFVDPITRILRGVRDAVGEPGGVEVLHLAAVVGAIFLIVLAVKRRGYSEAAYMAAVLLMAVSAENWDSLERYLLNCFAYVTTAALAIRNDRAAVALLGAGGAGMGALAALAWLGHYVP